MAVKDLEMKVRQVGNQKIIEFDELDEAIAYAEAKAAYQELWMKIVELDLNGWISPN